MSFILVREDFPNNMENEGNKINKWLIIGGVVVLILVIAILVSSKKGQTPTNNAPANNNPSSQNAPAGNEEAATSTEGQTTPIAVEGAVTEAPGASLILDDKVVNNEGVEVKNDVTPMAPEAPQQTAPITDKNQLSEKVIKIEVSAEKGFQPASFTVKAGQPVTVSISSVDDYTHVFAFKDASLSAVAVGVANGETRAITFKAPTATGEYVYYCNVPGHEARGESGKMIVE